MAGNASSAPVKAEGSHAGWSRSSPASAAKGTLRDSRTPRVFAMFTRIRKIHVRSDERPSNLVEALQHPDPRVLDDLVGDGLGRDEHPSDASHRGAEPIDELHEGGLVTGAQSFDERQIGIGRADGLHGRGG